MGICMGMGIGIGICICIGGGGGGCMENKFLRIDSPRLIVGEHGSISELVTEAFRDIEAEVDADC